MAIFTIGDLHLSLGVSKPMDIFKGWEGYVQKLEANWRSCVGAEDTVVLAGDISWGMKLPDCAADFSFLHSLPGRKLLMKGNHDYWWTTVSKMQAFCMENGWDSLSFLHNNCFVQEGMALCGTRSWLFEAGEAHDEKVMRREQGRLEASLQAAYTQAKEAEPVVFLHYPPVAAYARAPEILALLQKYQVQRCYYGHLHGASVHSAVQGMQEGVSYKLISADALQFCPLRI